MSEAADRDLARKRHWAEPGSRHDRLVRAAKYVLPVLIGGLLLILAIAPFDKRGDASFILDKNKVAAAEERMRVDAARYTGSDDKGQKFSINANRAIQPTSDRPVVDIEGMSRAARPCPRAADDRCAARQLQSRRAEGGGRRPGPRRRPRRLSARNRDVAINLKNRNLASSGRVRGEMRLGQFEAGRMSADLGTREVVLSDGVRLKIRQGAIK